MKESTNLNYTIIIPHYNIPQLLKRCLDSIPQRQDIQILVVDNNSTKENRQSAMTICADYPQVTYIQDEIGNGAGHARNIGLDHAKGKWLLFADADDFFVDNLSDILDLHIDSVEDIVFFRKRSVYSDDITKEARRSQWNDMFFDEYLKTKNELEFRRSFYTPWGKIIRRQLVENNNIRFDEIPYSNDAYFSVRSSCQARNIAIRNYPIYVVTVRDGSLMSNYCKKPGELEVRYDVCYRIQCLLKEYNYPIDLGYLSRMTYLLYKNNKKECLSYIDKLKDLNISFLSFLHEINRNLNRRKFVAILKIVWMYFFLKFE